VSSQQQKRHGIAANGLLALLLCAVLLAAHGYTRTHDNTHHAQRGEFVLTPIIESEWGGTARASRPDHKPDAWAHVFPDATIGADPLEGGNPPAATAVVAGLRSITLPGIRAPPHHAKTA
jgi:hypothetical protein